MTKLFDNIFAHHGDGDAFLVSIVCLLAVILFVLVLYIYAKWLLAQARHQRRISLSRPGFLDPTHFPSANSLTVDTTLCGCPTKGLEASAIASIPLFVYDSSSAGRKSGLECVVCLSLFEHKEMGKRLPDCGHGFHVECIDMWLSSHSNCPVCRVGVRGERECKVVDIDSMANSVVNEDSASDIVVDIDNGNNGVEVLSHSSSALCFSGVEGWSNSSSARVSLSARLSTARLSSSSLSSQIAAMGGSLMRLMSRNA